MALSSLIISIKADDMASSVIKSVAESVRSFAGEISRVAFTNIINGVEDATIALGKFQMELELTDIAFTQMIKGADRGMHSMEEYTQVAKAFRNELHDLAAETPFSFMSVNKAARQMMAYGFALHDIVPMLINIGDAAAAFGGSPVVIDRIVRALGQIRTYGRLKGQELLQLTEAGVPAHQILAEELGLTREQLSRIADQQISAEDAIKAILTGIQKRYEGMMEVQSRTLKGSIAAIRDNFLLVATQLTEDVYSEFSSGIQNFRRNVDQWKNMTRVYGWRGMFGRQVFYDKDGREVDVSKLSKEDLQDKIKNGELRREFVSDRYIDKKGKLADLTGLSQEEIAFKEAKGDITREGPLISLDWQQSIFTFGDYILELIKRIKELGNSLGRLWNTLFGGTDGLSDVGYAIFRMINGFIVLITTITDVISAFVSFTDTMLETGSTGRFLQSVIIGIFSAIEMAAIVTLIEKFAMLAATFQIVIGFAGIIGIQFGAMVGIAYLVGQSSEDAATGVLAVGTALMIIANRAMIAGAAIMTWNAVLSATRTIVAGVKVIWTSLVTIFITVRNTILALHAVWVMFSASLVVGTTLAGALRGAFVLLNMIFGGSRLVQIALTAATVATTIALEGLTLAYTATVAVVESCIAVFHILRGTYVAVGGATAIFTLTIQGATLATEIFSGAITVLSAVMTAFRAKILLIIAIIGTVIAVLYNAFDAVKQAVNSLFIAIANAFSDLINWFLEKLSSWSKSAYDGFVDTFAAIGKSVKELLGSVFSGLWNDTSNFVKGILQRLGPLGKLIEEIGTKVSNAWETAVSPDGSMIGKFESFVKEFTGIKDMSKLDEYTDSYYNPLNIPSGESKKDKQEKTKNQLQQWEKDVSLGEYFAYISTSIDAVGKSFDDMLPSLLQATKSFSDFSGTIEDFQKYALAKPGNGINNSIAYSPNDENYALKRGNIILYTGEDGKLHSALYMGDNKIRVGAGEITKKFVEVASGKMSVRDVTIEPQGAGECTIKSAKAFLGYYGQDNEGLTFSNWANRMRDFVGNNGYDISSYSEYEQHMRDHFANSGGPVMVYQTGGLGGHELNPNSKHAFVIAGQDEQGNWIVKDPAGGVTKIFHNLADTWDSSAGSTGDLDGAPTGHAIWYKNDSFESVQSNNKLIKWVHSFMPNLSEDIINYTAKTAQEYGVSLAQAFAQMYAESEGNINARSSVGAIGLMQLMPNTAAGLGVNPYDPYENITGGIIYMRQQLDKFGDMASAVAAYNAGPGTVEKYGGVPNYSETVKYVEKVMSKMKTFPTDLESVGSSVVKILKEVAETELSSIDSIKDSIVSVVNIDAFGETMRIEDTVSKERAKALNRQYKEQEKINKATTEYQQYMLASKLQLDELNGTLTDYRMKVLEVNKDYNESLVKAEKLVGQGLSREYAERMKARAKEVAESILREFERVKRIEVDIEYKTSQAKIAELNHNFSKSLGLQYEADVLRWEDDAFEYAKKILPDASSIQDLLKQYREVSKTPSRQGVSFSDFMQEAFSVNEPFNTDNSLGTFVETNKAYLDEWVTYVEAKRQEIDNNLNTASKTLFSKTVESYTNQGDLKGLRDYIFGSEGEDQQKLEQSFTLHQEWCNRLVEVYRNMGNEVQQAMLTIHSSMIEHGTSAIMDFIKGTKSAKEAFKDFALSVMEDILKLTVRNALTQAFSFMIPARAEGGRVKAGETVLVGEKGPELLSVTSSSNALNNPKTQIVGKDGPELITIPYTGFIISNEDVGKMLGYYSDSNPIGYMIDGFRAEGGNVKKDKAYIVGERGPEVFSPSTSGNIFSNEQLNSTLSNLDKISRSGSMSSVDEDAPKQTIPPVVVNLENRSNTEMNAQAESNFDGEKWVISVIMDAVNRNVNGLRNVIGNVSSRRN